MCFVFFSDPLNNTTQAQDFLAAAHVWGPKASPKNWMGPNPNGPRET